MPAGEFIQEAQIQVGGDNDVIPGDQLGQLIVEDRGGPWTDYMVYNRYVDNPYVYMGAVTSPEGFQNDSAVFLQLAAPTLLLACDWTAARWGAQPRIPDPNMQDPDWVFLGKTPETVMPPLGTDAVTPLYRISGTYFYGRRNPSSNTYSLMSFTLDPRTTGQYDRTVPSSTLTQGIIQTGALGGGKGKQKNLQGLVGFAVLG